MKSALKFTKVESTHIADVTLLASTRLSVHCPNTLIQESVRAYYRGLHQEPTTDPPRIESGYPYRPEKPSLGIALRPGILDRPDCTIRESV